MQYVFLTLMCVFACAYAFVKRGGGLINRLFFKSAASVMFVLTAVSLRIGAPEPYYTLILIGLCMSLAGDALLVFATAPEKRDLLVYSLAGGFLFLFAQIFYICGFFIYAALSWYDAVFFMVFLCIGAAAFGGKRPRLGRLAVPVYAYAIVLCIMAAKAVSMLFAVHVRRLYAVFAAAGGVLFALSDLALGMKKLYPKAGTLLDALNTAMYYGAQGLIALSVAL